MSKWAKDIARVTSRDKTFERLLNEPPKNDRDRAWQERVRQNLRDCAIIDAELQDAGVPFSVSELRGVSANYAEALPVLRKYLRDAPNDNDDVLLEILGALSVPYATKDDIDAVNELLYRRRAGASDQMLFDIGKCLAAMTTKAESNRLLAIVSDSANGTARLKPLLRLARWKDNRIEPVVIQMLDNGDFTWSAIRAARYLRLRAVEKTVERHLSSPNADLRAEARAYFKAIHTE